VSNVGLRGALRLLAALTAVVLLVIGFRFLLVPHQASRFFGLAPAATPGSLDLHYVIGLRDIWLAAILAVLTALQDWRGLAIWLGFGVLVCAGDAVIVVHSGGKPFPIAFHLASGIFCAALAAACWRQYRTPDH
jgi:hypothetical protein